MSEIAQQIDSNCFLTSIGRLDGDTTGLLLLATTIIILTVLFWFVILFLLYYMAFQTDVSYCQEAKIDIYSEIQQELRDKKGYIIFFVKTS